MTFTDVVPGVHTLELLVTSLVSEQTATVKRSFEIGSQSSFCGLHLINDGAVADTHKLRVEFGAVPMANSYHCQLDDQSGFDCKLVCCQFTSQITRNICHVISMVMYTPFSFSSSE